MRLGFKQNWIALTRLLVAVGVLVALGPSPKALGSFIAPLTTGLPLAPVEDRESEENQNESSEEETAKTEASVVNAARQMGRSSHGRHSAFLPMPLQIHYGKALHSNPTSIDQPADSLRNGLSSHYRC